MMLMPRKNHRMANILGTVVVLTASLAFAHVKVAKLAEELLFGDQPTRTRAIQDFNKLPADAQERLVPDFMVALTDEDPQVRKIAARILKAMGVKTGDQIPDAQKEMPSVSSRTATEDKWVEEKKMRTTVIPDARKELTASTTQAAGDDRWSDLTKMRGEESGRYGDMKEQLENEKKGQVILDASQLRSNDASSSPMSTVVASLQDPDPWVRAQAARRLAMVHPAPMEAIPMLIKMLGDKETESRRAAVAALGSFGHLATEALIPLNAALSDPDPAVRTLAADALNLIKSGP